MSTRKLAINSLRPGNLASDNAPVSGPSCKSTTVPCLRGLTSPSAIFAAAWFQQRYGYRRVIQVGLVAMFCFIFIVFFAQNIVSDSVSSGRITDPP